MSTTDLPLPRGDEIVETKVPIGVNVKKNIQENGWNTICPFTKNNWCVRVISSSFLLGQIFELYFQFCPILPWCSQWCCKEVQGGKVEFKWLTKVRSMCATWMDASKWKFTQIWIWEDLIEIYATSFLQAYMAGRAMFHGLRNTGTLCVVS